MTDVLSKIPLLGWGPILTLGAIAVCFLILAILLWRNHKVWRWVFVFLFLVFGVGTGADVANTPNSWSDCIGSSSSSPPSSCSGRCWYWASRWSASGDTASGCGT